MESIRLFAADLLDAVPASHLVAQIDARENHREADRQHRPDRQHAVRAVGVVDPAHDGSGDRGRKRSRRADDRQQQRAASREPLRRDAQHRRPPERGAGGKERRGGERRKRRAGHAEEEESCGGRDRGGGDERDRRDAMRGAAEELPHQIHDAVHPDEHEDAGLRRALHHVIENVAHPLAWTELGRRREPHADPDDDEQRAQDLLEHVAERDSGSGAFGLRERLTGEQERVPDRRDEHQQHLGLPAGVRRERGRVVPGLREQEAQDPADDNAAGEPGVERDEPARLVAGIHRRHEWIHGRFDEAVGDADDERGRKEDGEIRRHDRGNGPADVADGGEPEQRAHAEEIAERSAQQDGEAKAPERGAGNPADVGFAQREQPFEVAHDVAANRERHGRRDERHAARAEQPLRRGRVDRVGMRASACAGFHGGDTTRFMVVQPSERHSCVIHPPNRAPARIRKIAASGR